MDQARHEAESMLLDEIAAIEMHPHHVQHAPGAKALAQPFATGNDARARHIGIDRVVGLTPLEMVVGVEQHHVELLLLRQAQRFGIGVGSDEIVRIDKGQVLAARRIESRVARRGQPAVLLADHAHLRQARGELGEDGRAAVGRTVIDHDDLVGRRIQRGEAFQAARQVGRDVVDRDYKREKRREIGESCGVLMA